ncbi:MAG: radical SAM protein [Candidatus Bathyarchaeota archaeon]
MRFRRYEGEKTNNGGAKIVLTSSATEMSDYQNSAFFAFLAGFAKGPLPLWILRKILYPPVEDDGDGRAKYAPYGLRKVEALLLENGFNNLDVAVVHPSKLNDFIGPETKVVGISSMDPMGMGYVSKTYSSLIGGGTSINAAEFEALVRNQNIRKYRPKIIVGGYGSWQLERKKIIESYGIDCVLIGGNVERIKEIFDKAVNGEPLPKVIRCENNSSESMPLIKHAAIHGCVEISSGCGRNCQFCTPTMQERHDAPLEKIMKEVEITIRDGASRVTLVTEDMFLYNAKDNGFIPNKKGVVKLVKSIANYPGVEAIQPSHMSLAPVVYDPNLVQEVAEILLDHNWYYHNKKKIVTGETGIETGSTRLMKKYMAGKMLPFKPEQWREIVTQAFGILNDNDWYPLATLIVGLPDEKEEDVVETLELMDDLKSFNAFYVPLFFVPLENCLLMNKHGAEFDSLTRLRWEFLIRCWQYNVRIWRDSYFEDRISNPFVNKLFKRVLMPCAAGFAGAYYRIRGGKIMQEATWKIINA